MYNRSRNTPASGSLLALQQAIELTGYYPDVVSEAVTGAIASEEVVSYYLHHEPTFDREEVRRHLTVLVLTPTRLVLAHTDEHPGDEMLAEPYTSTSTEAIVLSTVRSVVVTRMVVNSATGGVPVAEVVLTIGWGGVGRIDLEPASCADPHCDADHGYTGVLAGDDFSLRVSRAAEGQVAVDGLLGFADALSARTNGA
jgi:hypothetical protein